MNKFLNKLERKFGKYAIPNLMYYIIILYIVGFVLSLFSDGAYLNYLVLDAEAIMRGEVWRILTFIVMPPDSNPIFLLFALFLYYMIGTELERVWGSFRFNLFFFSGMLWHVIAALLAYFIFPEVKLVMGTAYLNLSLFFAFAAVYPNQQLYLFGIFPIKMKYLAWIDGAYFGYAILQAFLPEYGGHAIYGPIYQARALAAFVSILNFFLFFLATRKNPINTRKAKQRSKAYHKAVNEATQERTTANGARHRCAVCGRTELDDPNLEFRYCSKCNGNYEYCQDHLFTHEHVK